MIVVITIIGILLAIGIGFLGSTQSRSKKESAVATAEKVKLKLTGYFDDKNRYPRTQAEVTSYITGLGDTTMATDFGDTTKFDYLGTTPDGSTCAATGVVKCEKYTITVKKSGWQGNVTDSDVVVTP